MRNYAIINDTPARFEGDFRLEPEQARDPEEQPFLDALQDAGKILAADEKTEKSTDLPAAMLTARAEARKNAVGKLREIATKFVEEEITAERATRSIVVQLRHYQSNLPRFFIKDVESPAVKDLFEVVSAQGNDPSEDERRYLANLSAVLGEISDDARQDPAAKISRLAIGQRAELREIFVSDLRASAKAFCSGDWQDPDELLIRTGQYRGARDRLAGKLFEVTGLSEEENNRSIGRRYVALSIALTEGLPAPQDKPSPEQEDLFTQLNKTASVITLVCERMKDEPESWWSGTGKSSNQAADRSARILHEYMDRLRGVGLVGLEQPHTTIAKVALNDLRAEFTAKEAGRIKNRYVRKLGVASGIFAAIFVTAYLSIYFSGWPWGQLHSSFLLAAAGAAIGTWLSFSVRQVQLAFDDLLLTEDNSLDPAFRVLFVIALTWTACLLFWTGVFNLEIGSLKTSAEAFQQTGSIALLIGIFCGLSERALATAISGRAAAFAQGVSGSR